MKIEYIDEEPTFPGDDRNKHPGGAGVIPDVKMGPEPADPVEAAFFQGQTPAVRTSLLDKLRLVMGDCLSEKTD